MSEHLVIGSREIDPIEVNELLLAEVARLTTENNMLMAYTAHKALAPGHGTLIAAGGDNQLLIIGEVVVKLSPRLDVFTDD